MTFKTLVDFALVGLSQTFILVIKDIKTNAGMLVLGVCVMCVHVCVTGLPLCGGHMTTRSLSPCLSPSTSHLAVGVLGLIHAAHTALYGFKGLSSVPHVCHSPAPKIMFSKHQS